MSRLARPAALVLLALAAGLGVWAFAGREPTAETPQARSSLPSEAAGTLIAPTLQGVRRAQPHAVPPPSGEAASAAIESEPSERSISLRVEIVDGLTGQEVAATWNMRHRLWDIEGLLRHAAREAKDEGGRRDLEVQAEGVHAKWESQFLASGIAREYPISQDGDVLDVRLEVRQPEGLVLLVPPSRVDAELAAGVEVVVAVVPVIREAVLELRVVGPDGRAAEGASLAHITLGGTLWPVEVEPLGPGRMRLRRLPHLPGELVEAELEWPAPAGEPPAEHRPLFGEDPSSLNLEVPLSLATPWIQEVRLPYPLPPALGHDESDNDMPEEQIEVDAGPTAPHGRVRIRLLDLHGRPVLGVPLFGIRPDAKGEVLLESLAPGRQQRGLQVPGRLPVKLDAEVRADEETLAMLREPVGGRLEVTVVDDQGRPRPAALLQIRDAVFFDVEAKTQRVDLFTDHLGRRSIARVEPGVAEVHASWGGRHGSEKVTVVDGETTRVRIVAR